MTSRTKAILQALLVTVFWSSSWVIIKIALKDFPPLSFAAYRFFIAFLCLLPFALKDKTLKQIKKMNWQAKLEIVLLGIFYYAVCPGGQNVGLNYLPANTLSLILNFTAILVAFLGVFLIKEKPSAYQWLGLGIFILGLFIYFREVPTTKYPWIGILIGIITMVANSLSSLLGRKLNREGNLSPLVITTISMGIGAILLLGFGIKVEGLVKPSPFHWLLIIWLAIVSTAFAYQLWNKTLRTLPAFESALINNTILPQITILAWIFLKERISLIQIIGLVVSILGIVIVQIFSTKKKEMKI